MQKTIFSNLRDYQLKNTYMYILLSNRQPKIYNRYTDNKDESKHITKDRHQITRENKAVASCSLILMASGPITSWQIDGAKVESVTDFTFVGSKISMDGDHSHKTK